MDGKNRERLPADRDSLILKPLFSFAGKGIEFGPSDELLASIPEDERSGYLLQERVHFEPVIETPFGPLRRRFGYCISGRTEGPRPGALAGASRSRQDDGVDHNRNQEWVGGSAGFFPPRVD